MKFRPFIITLFVLFSLLFSWNLLCTWKKSRLEKEAIEELFAKGSSVDYGKVEKHLHEKKKIWDLPFFGVIDYEKLCRYALSMGGDLTGSRRTTVTVDQVAMIKGLLAKKGNLAFTQAEQAFKEDEKGKCFIDFFCDETERSFDDNLVTFFETHSGIIKKNLNNKAMRAHLHDHAKSLTTQCKAVLLRRLNQGAYSKYEVSKQTQGNQESLVLTSPRVSEDNNLTDLVEHPGILNFFQVVSHEEFSKTNIAKNLNQSIQNMPHSNKKISYVHEKNNSYYCNSGDVEKVLKAADSCLNPQKHRIAFEAVKNRGERCVVLLKYSAPENKLGFQVESAKIQNTENSNKSGLSITLQKDNTEKMKKLTNRIRTDNTPPLMAIVLDDTVLMTAGVKVELGREMSISGGNHKKAYWENIKDKLLSGSLPAKLKTTKKAEVLSPSLGRAAQEQGFMAIAFALLLVLLFMFCWYARAGGMANIALFFNILFILGTLAQFGAALTLPGIAGIVLTIGMAVDSNVIIFEAIREEIRRKTPLAKAVKKGYANAYRSIIDSNITTLLTGFILFWLGDGQIKGFAATLLIGILASFFTAVVLTQLLLEGAILLFGANRLSFSYAFSRGWFINSKINFLGRRKLTYLISLLFIGTGMGLTYMYGIEKGIVFTGGKQFTVRFGGDMKVKKMEQDIRKAFTQAKTGDQQSGSTTVQKISNSNRVIITTNTQIKGVETCIKKVLRSHGQNFVRASNANNLEKNQFTIESNAEVDATVAQSAWWNSMIAVLLALLAMLLYIFLSFGNFKLALAALVALLHDTLALFACLAIAKFFGICYAVDMRFLCTVLTVIGYSINDTVVVFNGMRKQMSLQCTKKIGKVANSAINTTLSRTLITSFTTLLPLFVLYFFGGPALESLAFLLGCGLLWGTFSSISVAVPIAHDIERFSTYLQGKYEWYKAKKGSGVKRRS